MKTTTLKNLAGLLCCSWLLTASAANITPVASWDAAPGDTAMTYRANGKAKGRYINVSFKTFKQGTQTTVAACFSNYNCKFITELPASLWKKKGDFTVTGKLRMSNVEKNDPKRNSVIFRMQKLGLHVNRAGNKGAKGKLSFNIYGKKSKSGSKGGHRYINSSARVDDGRWHTFKVSVNKDKMTMWVDGKKAPKVPVLDKNSNPLPFKKTLQIGGSAKGLLLSDLRFYDCALPQPSSSK